MRITNDILGVKELKVLHSLGGIRQNELRPKR